MTHAQVVEHAKWRRLFTAIVVTVAGAYVAEVLWTETKWQEFFNENPELWIVLVTAFVTWTVCSVFWLFVLSMLRAGHAADIEAERSLNRQERFKSRVDERTPDYGGRK